MITTVNYHITEHCNFNCRYCFARYKDVKGEHLSLEEKLKIISELKKCDQFRKINFAGGEPTLDKDLPAMIRHAHNLGFETSVVTNGSLINKNWVKSLSGNIDMIGISIDSFDKATNEKLGCSSTQGTLNINNVFSIADTCNTYGVKLKINTVVTKLNKNEVMKNYIADLSPARWKILQATEIKGQNDTEDFKSISVSGPDFETFVANNTFAGNVKIVSEKCNDITGSYLMVDYSGRFYDNMNGQHNYSSPILEVGAESAITEVTVDDNKFINRGGNYSIKK